MSKYVRGNLRLSFFLLIFLSLLPGFLLTIYSLISSTHFELLIVFIIGVCTLSISWFGIERLIFRRVKDLIALSKRLAAGDLTVRSGQTESIGVLGELTQAFDQLANSLESQTQQLQTRAFQVAVISEMAGEIAIERDISALLQRILEMVMKLLGTSHSALILYDPAVGDLVITATKGLNIPIGTRINMGEGTVGRAAQTRQPVIIDDYVRWGDSDAGFQFDPGSTVIQVPMAYRGELVGVLGVVIPTRAYQDNQEVMYLLNLFAEQAANAINNARLFEDTHRRLQMMETINEISIALRVAQTTEEMLPVLLEKTTAMVHAILGSIWLYDRTDSLLHKIVSLGIPMEESRLDPSEGMIGKAFSSGQPEYAPDRIEAKTKDTASLSQLPIGTSGAFVPIRTTHAVVGVLVLGFQAPTAWAEDQKQLMTTIAEMAGNAIHRMQLHEQTVSQLKRLSALHQIDLAITGSLDLRYTLQVLLNQVISQLGVDAACALTYNANEKTLGFAASRGFTTDALRSTHLPISQGYAGLAAREQRTVCIPDLNQRTTDFLRSPSFSAEGFVTYYAVPLIVRSQIKGVLEVFHRSRLEHDPEWLDFLEALASQAAIAIENASLYNDLQQSNIELNLAYDATLDGWSRALDLRDEETEGHTQRVTEITMKLARTIGISAVEMVHLRRGALLHDIGKLGVPDHILLKPSKLAEEEWAIMRRHPVYAYHLLSPIAYLRPALDIPYCHHEKWDGSGYPRGLKEEEIPLSARIFSVVDVWDALRSDRPYRKGWPEEKVRAYLQEQAGQHFDPRIVDAFLSLLRNESEA